MDTFSLTFGCLSKTRKRKMKVTISNSNKKQLALKQTLVLTSSIHKTKRDDNKPILSDVNSHFHHKLLSREKKSIKRC